MLGKSTLAEQKYLEDRGRSHTFVSHLSPQEHAQAIRLVGRKFTFTSEVSFKWISNRSSLSVLWNTVLLVLDRTYVSRTLMTS